LLIFSAVASCKKNGAPAVKEKLLSKMYQDDELRYEFEYSSDKKLKKVTKYNGAFTPYEVYQYEYDGKGQLMQKIHSNGSGKPITKFLYTWTDQGQVAKYTATELSGADSGKIEYWVSFAYNERKRLVKMSNFLADDNLVSSQSLEYNDNGALLEMRLYSEKPAGSSLVYLYEYTGANFRIHPSFMKAWIEPGESNLIFYHATGIKITQYDDGAVKSVHTYTMTDRKSDDPGAGWTEQTITYKKTFPAGFNPDIRKMRYEYIEL
jgi:hypothetical protein